MDQEDLRYFDALLRAKKAELLRQLEYIERTAMKNTPRDAAGDLSSVAFHMADQGSDSYEHERAFLFASREGRYLYHIDEALERIASGEFGICCVCGEQIARERLEAVPHTLMCLRCKSREESSGRKNVNATLPPPRTVLHSGY